jgi:hypothetical protein
MIFKNDMGNAMICHEIESKDQWEIHFPGNIPMISPMICHGFLMA